ncbi:unnamed protein product [Darwinula stevensoni]|uniref:BolA-like protein n=1 Tax=Darwinula stevensoni TaxID=69355 RepID=A0A7R9AAP4_9CRUS|nr:unnamed protein product [Darwinula stevensoni]CAG0898646.1 unnamed protein product [Darwinula stevensoni]
MFHIRRAISIKLPDVLGLTRSTLCKMSGQVANTIRTKLASALLPSHLNVINESFMHNVPKGSETHFKVVVVSDKFLDLSPIQKHRLVYDILKEEVAGGVHALSIQVSLKDGTWHLALPPYVAL